MEALLETSKTVKFTVRGLGLGFLVGLAVLVVTFGLVYAIKSSSGGHRIGAIEVFYAFSISEAMAMLVWGILLGEKEIVCVHGVLILRPKSFTEPKNSFKSLVLITAGATMLCF